MYELFKLFVTEMVILLEKLQKPEKPDSLNKVVTKFRYYLNNEDWK